MLDDAQEKFREGRGYVDQMYSFHSVVAEKKARGEDTFMCFIDVKKTHDPMWRVLRSM